MYKTKINMSIQLIDNLFEKIFSKTVIALTLTVFLGIIIRIYFTPWDLPTNSPDAFGYMLEGIAYSKGDFSYFNTRTLWPAVLSIFFVPFKFENYFEYITIMRIVSISISVLTIPILFLISRKVLENKYAILTTVLFTIEPNLVENSIFGITEPIFIMIGLISVYFAMNVDRKFLFIGFMFAGLAFDTRLNGIVLLFVMLIVSKVHIQNKKQFIYTISIGVGIFLLVIFPHFAYPIISETSPFPIINGITKTIFEEEVSYSTVNSGPVNSSFDIISNAAKNEFLHIFRISVPFLIILAPFGIITAVKEMNRQKIILFSCIIISLIIALPQYTISNEYRNLFFITPFLSIFASMGIQKILPNVELKNIFLLLLISGLILLSGFFLNDRYTIDKELFLEKDKIGKHIAKNFQGTIMGHHYLETVRNMDNILPGVVSTNESLYVLNPGIPMRTIDELLNFSINNNVDFLVMESSIDHKHFPIFSKIMVDEKKFIFFEKVFDSSEHGYKKIHTKIFKIDYSKYDKKE